MELGTVTLTQPLPDVAYLSPLTPLHTATATPAATTMATMTYTMRLPRGLSDSEPSIWSLPRRVLLYIAAAPFMIALV